MKRSSNVIQRQPRFEPKWVVTNNGTKTKPMIKARFMGREFADDTKKGELFAGMTGPY